MMELRYIGCIGLFGLFFMECVIGICMNSSLKTEKTEYGTTRRFCEYHVDEGNTTVTLQIMPGSRFETRDCMECRCTDQGFKCCGIGVNSRMFWVPDDCRVVSNGCEPMMVLKSNIYLDCFTKRPVHLKRKSSPQMQKQRAIRRMLKQQRMKQRRMGQEIEVESPNKGLNTLGGMRGLGNLPGMGNLLNMGGLGNLGGMGNLMGMAGGNGEGAGGGNGEGAGMGAFGGLNSLLGMGGGGGNREGAGGFGAMGGGGMNNLMALMG